ncbi:hypothetical protein HET73_05875 [Wolbachia endosymbiont of Atemnus politus]|uniref:hypothetical protein n=1 Tax=Wolbachia endosymbiont of Atemnus politus TaxID=2682840 RepID=UPI001573E6EE|nr:hypothetical protein [Wolbachia endosymbiont of Atemnus politus]NSM56884.1 hypothetical protein [Wolbachia endosymbiont of Atemnus politus]
MKTKLKEMQQLPQSTISQGNDVNDYSDGVLMKAAHLCLPFFNPFKEPGAGCKIKMGTYSWPGGEGNGKPPHPCLSLVLELNSANTCFCRAPNKLMKTSIMN